MKNRNLYLLLSLLLVAVSNINAQKVSDYYKISTVPIPKDIVLEVGGLAFDDKGQLAASTRRGEVWVIDNPESNQPTFTKFANGLHEPLGLAYKDGSYFIAQRGELSKVTDENKDGRADLYETIYNWPLVANYHEYAYGPLILEDGNMIINLNLGWVGRGASLSKWSGWMLMITPEGEMTPIATGMRSPAGLGRNAAGDIFYTENQGDWVGSGRMSHVEKGDFLGHPEGLKWSGEVGSPLQVKMEDIKDDEETTLYEYAKTQPALKPPSVWFPHTLMGISTSDIDVFSDNFGPFGGQLMVGDQGHSKIMRVFQEKINGEYQGICFPFVEGFSSGVLRTEWNPDKDILYVGMTNRGWASTGKSPYGLQRLKWTGKTPFEMKTVKAQSNGFEIEFTQPVDRRTAANPDSYEISDFNYKYHHFYGSDAIMVEERTVFKVEVSQDGLRARLFLEGMREGFIYEIKAKGVKNKSGQSLLNDFGYYTLNNIPDGERVEADHSNHDAGAVTNTVAIASAKRITKMPSSWLNGPDQVVKIGTTHGMRFDTKSVTVKAGSKIKLELNNPDDMMHNFLLVQPKSATKVGQMAEELGLKGHSKGYVPDSDLVLAHTSLLAPNSADVIYFVAPETPGNYEYVCTFPAHAATMRGVMKVVE